MSRRKQVLLRTFKVEIFRSADMDHRDTEDLFRATDGVAGIIETAIDGPLKKVNEALDFYVSEDD